MIHGQVGPKGKQRRPRQINFISPLFRRVIAIIAARPNRESIVRKVAIQSQVFNGVKDSMSVILMPAKATSRMQLHKINIEKHQTKVGS